MTINTRSFLTQNHNFFSSVSQKIFSLFLKLQQQKKYIHKNKDLSFHDLYCRFGCFWAASVSAAPASASVSASTVRARASASVSAMASMASSFVEMIEPSPLDVMPEDSSPLDLSQFSEVADLADVPAGVSEAIEVVEVEAEEEKAPAAPAMEKRWQHCELKEHKKHKKHK